MAKLKTKGLTSFSLHVGYYVTVPADDLDFDEKKGLVSFTTKKANGKTENLCLLLRDVASITRTGVAGDFVVSYYRVEATGSIVGTEEDSRIPGMTRIRRAADNKVFYYNANMVFKQSL